MQDFPSIDFTNSNASIFFTSNLFLLKSEIIKDELKVSAESVIYLENNRTGYIISRSYNGL